MNTTTAPVGSSQYARGVKKNIYRSIFLWLIFLPLVFVVIVPLIYEVSMAFTLESNQLNFPIEWIPNPVSISNFSHIFADTTLPILRWFGNSLLVSTVGTVIVVFFSTLSGYAFARLEFPGRSLLFSILLFSLMIPMAVTLIPSFLLLRDLKLLDSFAAIWMPAAASVTGIFLMRQFIETLPDRYETIPLPSVPMV